MPGFGSGGFGYGGFGVGMQIEATPEPDLARIRINVTAGIPDMIAYIIRRDKQGSVLVRETSVGTVTYDVNGNLQVYDYEARQGLETTYLVANDQGEQMESTTLTIPSWGTWLKSVGRPFMNTKVLWNADSEYTRKSRRSLIQVRGAKFPVAHTDRHLAPSGVIRVATETEDQARKLTSLVESGGILMVDVDRRFGVPVRYVSVGDITGSRVGASDRGLSWEARIWDMQVDEVAAPIGLPAGQGLTYEAIRGSFDSYIALAAIVPTYDDLAAGTW